MRNAESEFYAIGKELKALDRPEVLAAFGHATFRAFVDAELMPYDRVQRYMVVADAYPKKMAVRLGVEKGFHLVQYAKVTESRLSARGMVERDARIGTTRQKVSELTARDVQNLVRVAKMSRAKAEAPKPSRLEKRAAAQLGRQFEERFGVDARVRVDKKRDVVRIEVSLSDWMDL